MLFCLAVFLGSLIIYQFFIKPQLFWKRRNVKQNFPIPILGDTWTTMFNLESFHEFAKRLYDKYPNERYIGMYRTVLPTLMIRDVDLIKQIAVKDFDHFMDHQSFTGPLESDDVWNKNLFTLRGQIWKEMRSTLSPTFTTNKMRAMFKLMKQSGEQYVDFYSKQDKDVIELEAKDSFTRFANDVIANCAFGVGCDSLHEPNNQFYLNGKELSDFNGFWKNIKFIIIAVIPKVAKVLNLPIFAPHLGKYFKTLVRDSINHREQNNLVRPDMINLLMEAKKGLLKYEEDVASSKSAGFATVEESDVGRTATNSQKMAQLTEVDMAAQVLIFFLAGFDTVSTMMTFMCYALATNPDIQEKLRQEVDDSYEQCNGNLTYDILAGMKYMDMVMTESLRMYPPAILLDRMCTKPYTIEPKRPGETPIHLNVGDAVLFPVSAIHSDPEHYADADKFIPERFSDENKGNIKPYTFLPFGVGPRNCIGSRFALMEIKTLFYNLLLKYEIVPTAKTPIPIRLVKGSFNPIIEGGCWVGFKKRSE